MPKNKYEVNDSTYVHFWMSTTNTDIFVRFPDGYTPKQLEDVIGEFGAQMRFVGVDFEEAIEAACEKAQVRYEIVRENEFVRI